MSSRRHPYRLRSPWLSRGRRLLHQHGDHAAHCPRRGVRWLDGSLTRGRSTAGCWCAPSPSVPRSSQLSRASAPTRVYNERCRGILRVIVRKRDSSGPNARSSHRSAHVTTCSRRRRRTVLLPESFSVRRRRRGTSRAGRRRACSLPPAAGSRGLSGRVGRARGRLPSNSF